MKTHKTKRRKRTNKNIPAKGRLRDICDRLWSMAVRNDWANRCAICGSRKCEAHHLATRQLQATRYDLQNGISLCPKHHKFDAEFSPHQNAAGFLEWLRNHHPSRHVWLLENYRLKFHGKTNADYYLETALELRQYLEPVDYDRIVGIKLVEFLEKFQESS